MSPTAIHVEGIGKLYRLGERQQYTGLRHRLEDLVRAPVRWLRSAADGGGAKVKKGPQEIWAVRDVSFDVQAGEVVGLIGRNGAGKSTLLKILCRVAQPTKGFAEIYGRVGSLLEVGTGFHQELTGRENVYLNGAVLGMGKKEIARKFDEIVAFAEVEDFIDTPLKHYSTGMMMRLAFAVAAHIEPEILLVDEVLAVGDIAFQKKCLGKMNEVAKGGRTIVFVSHQINQIRRLCERTIWMDQGRVHMSGPTAQVAGAYEALSLRGSDTAARSGAGGREIRDGFVSWEIVEPRAEEPHTLTTLGPVRVKFVLRLSQPILDGTHGIALFNHERQLMWGWAVNGLKLEPGLQELEYTFPMLPLRPGLYSWLLSLFNEEREIDMWECVPEMVIATPVHQHSQDNWNGVLNVPSEFRTTQKSEAGTVEDYDASVAAARGGADSR